ncbi:MAG: HlyD family efflux transporter periplasmic adaptor subunit [Gammaproteobacteria bacterium]|nr:HlyD family efflux transporter periplasmic adaptor subunit [Gammaproteobacteria bacterium]MBQ0838842.1 HlyD family efflux transporter periplasmic adaptor subunit [Gammaproteobacteria bacterium]
MSLNASLFSQSWYLVSELSPRLRRHTAIHRHLYRGEIWYVLQDHASGQFHRFTPEAYLIIGKMNGQRSLQQIWEEACELLGDDMPTQDDIIGLVSKLFSANVLHSDSMPDMEALDRRHAMLARQKLMQKIKSPLAVRIPLFDPERFLNNTMAIAAPFFTRWMAVLWVVVVGVAGLMAAVHWDGLTGNLSDRILAASNLLLMALIYPFVKTLHELGHAYAVKRWGGEVHEIGIMFLVFFPVPYVDASAATAFRSKYQRMLVGAIGILIEGFIAALAMLVWTLAEPGLVRALAFNTMLISGVSTVFFNGNPLLRFDAYYVLADFLEIPNLAKRSASYVGYWVKSSLMGVRGLISPAATGREARWLVAYALSSYLYRIVIMMSIALFIASEYLFIGTLLAMWTLWGGIVQPLFKLLAKPFSDTQLQQKAKRTWGVISLGVLALVLLLGVIPFPYATYTHGVLTASDNSQVRVRSSGFLDETLAQPGSQVEQGQALLRLKDPTLDAEVAVLGAQVREAEARHLAALGDRVESGIAQEFLDFRRLEYRRARDKETALTLVAQKSGTFILPHASSLHGRYLSRGDLLGNIVNFDQLPVTVLVDEDHINAVRNRTRAVEVRMVSQQRQTFPATISRIVPASTQTLANDILAVEAGGLIITRPDTGSELPQAFKHHFRLVLDAPQAPRERLNERVHVLFHHQPEPLLWRWLRDLRRVFLRQLDV